MKWIELKAGDWLFDDHAQFSEHHNWLIIKIVDDVSWWMRLDNGSIIDDKSNKEGDVPSIYTVIRGGQTLQEAKKTMALGI